MIVSGSTDGIHVPASAVRAVYGVMMLANAVMILVTAASDLGYDLPQGAGQFDLKLEGNFAVWYSSALLLCVSAAALVMAYTPARDEVRAGAYRLSWVLGALFFAGLSADETIEAHERIGLWFTSRFGTVPGLTEGGWAVFGWLAVFLPVIAIVIVAGFVMVRSWLSAHALSRSLALAGLFCWIGVIGSEFVEAQLARLAIARSLLGAIEEGLEIVGTALFFAAFCEFLIWRGSFAHEPSRSESGPAPLERPREVIHPRSV